VIVRNGFRIHLEFVSPGFFWGPIRATVATFWKDRVTSDVYRTSINNRGKFLSAERMKSPKDWSPAGEKLPRGWTLICPIDDYSQVSITTWDDAGHERTFSFEAHHSIYYMET
jgi:hypothetical protein